MRYLTIEQTLIYVDGPQLVLGRDGRDMKYVGLAIPSEGYENKFLAVQVSDQLLEDYLAEHVDLRFVFKRPKRNKYYSFILEEVRRGAHPLIEIEAIEDDWLPDSGFFASNHTEPITHSSYGQSANTLDIKIDGRWDIQDLSQFPNKFADAYSFLYALDSEPNENNRFANIFDRYPWRGGFSAVGFYNDLYTKIPRAHRLAVKEINYASPGKIKLTAVPDIANEIQTIVENINSNWSEIREQYLELQEGMSERKFLGRSHHEITLSDSDKAFLENAVGSLCRALQFSYLERIFEMVGNDWLATSKIVASFYRRVSELAEFYDSGKASFID